MLDGQNNTDANGTTAPATAPATNANGTSSAANDRRRAARRNTTAEKRASHNAVEKARRETLNGRFLVSPSSFFLSFSHPSYVSS